jgi:ribosome-associated protein
MSPTRDDDLTARDEQPSKSELKRQSHELQALGETLIGLPAGELDELPLPDNLRDAVLLARRITSRGGLYRQKQYIGKLMRRIDAEPIRTALEARRVQARLDALGFRRIESWRDRLIAEDASTLRAFLEECPGADRARMDRLIAQARHERANGRPPRAARELFGLVREALEDLERGATA